MTMFKPKSAKSVKDYIAQIDEPRKSEIKKLRAFIKKTLPKLDEKMYHGTIGYGAYHYKSKSSEGDWFTLGLASQKNYISIYLCSVDHDQYLAEKHKDWFPKASIGKSCIRFKRVENIDFAKLKKILKMAEKLGPMNKAT